MACATEFRWCLLTPQLYYVLSDNSIDSWTMIIASSRALVVEVWLNGHLLTKLLLKHTNVQSDNRSSNGKSCCLQFIFGHNPSHSSVTFKGICSLTMTRVITEVMAWRFRAIELSILTDLYRIIKNDFSIVRWVTAATRLASLPESNQSWQEAVQQAFAHGKFATTAELETTRLAIRASLTILHICMLK